ncbi:TIGR00730 family Rossman fold protein [Neptuniibacter halophilus]|uniref:LOG family protein n=1 Tax=Neptuniibacter halophilus TaxID=651666 RepID=UPI0025734E7F|nr:TIGR00730 family Rossman fold protein [Neptuniibacter halophilus]
MQNIAVFCGAKPGNDPVYRQAAVLTGQALARAGLGLVFGGSVNGLMGTVADAALAEGGRVIGVMPEHLTRQEPIHPGLSELIPVDTMAERKSTMLEISDGFLALPGGSGTLDEIFEAITLSQIGQHRKPCAFLNIEGFYDPLLAFLAGARDQGFLHPDYYRMLICSGSVDEILRQMDSFVHPHSR